MKSIHFNNLKKSDLVEFWCGIICTEIGELYCLIAKNEKEIEKKIIKWYIENYDIDGDDIENIDVLRQILLNHDYGYFAISYPDDRESVLSQEPPKTIEIKEIKQNEQGNANI